MRPASNAPPEKIGSDDMERGKDITMKKYTAIIAAWLVILLTLSACGTAPAKNSQSEELSFSITTLTGDTLDESVFTDHKLIMVNYWATWCGPCVGEIPDLVKISKDYENDGFALIGVLTGDKDINGAKKFIADEKVTYPVVLPEAFFADHATGISAIPTTMFFDSEGKQVGDTIIGSKSYEEWTGLIEILMGLVK
jgi:thiol-disulfide isomerase/thioredoxin